MHRTKSSIQTQVLNAHVYIQSLLVLNSKGVSDRTDSASKAESRAAGSAYEWGGGRAREDEESLY